MRNTAACADLLCHYGGRTGVAAVLMGLALLAGLTGCSSQAVPVASPDAKPVRIASMNPCIDAVLMEIAAPEQIAAISHYSQDPRATSVPLNWARRYPAVSDAAEDVIAADPDLVIAGQHVAIQTIDTLKRLGIPLMQVPVPATVDENKAQITAIARRIGRTQQGAALNARIDGALRQAESQSPPISALIWQSSGLVPGKGTLADELLHRTGFRNASAEMGLKMWDILPLEGLLMHPPKVLLTGEANMVAGDTEANRMLTHPALQKARRVIPIANFPSNLLHCGGPVIIRSVQRLAAVRQSLKVPQ